MHISEGEVGTVGGWIKGPSNPSDHLLSASVQTNWGDVSRDVGRSRLATGLPGGLTCKGQQWMVHRWGSTQPSCLTMSSKVPSTNSAHSLANHVPASHSATFSSQPCTQCCSGAGKLKQMCQHERPCWSPLPAIAKDDEGSSRSCSSVCGGEVGCPLGKASGNNTATAPPLLVTILPPMCHCCLALWTALLQCLVKDGAKMRGERMQHMVMCRKPCWGRLSERLMTMHTSCTALAIAAASVKLIQKNLQCLQMPSCCGTASGRVKKVRGEQR